MPEWQMETCHQHALEAIASAVTAQNTLDSKHRANETEQQAPTEAPKNPTTGRHDGRLEACHAPSNKGNAEVKAGSNPAESTICHECEIIGKSSCAEHGTQKSQKYWKVTMEGSKESLITQELHEIELLLNEEELGQKYVLEVVEMSEDEMEKLFEWDGF